MAEKVAEASYTFQAKKRTGDFGSAGSRRIVRAGGIPAVVYGKKAPEHIIINAKQFGDLRKYLTLSTLVEVEIEGGENALCLVKAVDERLLTNKVLHLDFFEITRGVPLVAQVEIRLTGTAMGVRDGGVLDQVLHTVEVECLPRDLPKIIKHDVSSMQANTSISLKELKAPEKVKFVTPLETTVASIKYADKD